MVVLISEQVASAALAELEAALGCPNNVAFRALLRAYVTHGTLVCTWLVPRKQRQAARRVAITYALRFASACCVPIPLHCKGHPKLLLKHQRWLSSVHAGVFNNVLGQCEGRGGLWALFLHELRVWFHLVLPRVQVLCLSDQHSSCEDWLGVHRGAVALPTTRPILILSHRGLIRIRSPALRALFENAGDDVIVVY